MQTINTPSGLKAQVLIPRWGRDFEPAGLRYIGDRSRERLMQVFLNPEIMFDLGDIAADMNEYKFGYMDDMDIPFDELTRTVDHVLPMTTVADDVPNCLWHADKLRLKVPDEMLRIFDPTAVTFLYPYHLSSAAKKETGFADPSIVCNAYQTHHEAGGRTIQPTSEALLRFAEALGRGMHEMDDVQYEDRFRRIKSVVQWSYQYMNTLLSEGGERGMHWLGHKRGRLMLFSNKIAHSNDLIRQNERNPRSQSIYRRMFPGRKFLSFNLGYE